MRVLILIFCFFICLNVNAKKKKVEENDRKYWCDLCYKISAPVLSNMSKGEFKKNLSIEFSPIWDKRNENVTYMEAFGRLMAGIAPWLSLPDDNTEEGKQRKQLKEWALESYKNSVDPDSPDYLDWGYIGQTLVDASYIANSFIRAREALWDPLDDLTKERYIKEFKGQRKTRSPYSNWLLFRAMIEAFLASIGEDYDPFVIDMVHHKIEEWYVGDGWYSDGPEYSFDYYNSYVIHPYVVEISELMESKKVRSLIKFDLALRRMQRYNQYLERLISPEGTFPAFGRSMTYRMGVFQPLALSAWKYGLPKTQSNGQVRAALTAVMKNMFSIEGNFSEQGFLQLGFVGHQPELADYYTNTGSLYITATVFLPLGLPANHDFWTAPAEEWTSKKAWSGKPFPKDYHESIKK